MMEIHKSPEMKYVMSRLLLGVGRVLTFFQQGTGGYNSKLSHVKLAVTFPTAPAYSADDMHVCEQHAKSHYMTENGQKSNYDLFIVSLDIKRISPPLCMAGLATVATKLSNSLATKLSTPQLYSYLAYFLFQQYTVQ